jgi:hypothetical protein
MTDTISPTTTMSTFGPSIKSATPGGRGVVAGGIDPLMYPVPVMVDG